MDKILEYQEKDYDNTLLYSHFICICPTSSNMILSQKKKIDPKGLTLVGFINKDIFNDVFDDLEGRYNFQKTIHPHVTMLGLFDENRKVNPYYEKLTIEKIEQFFHDKEKNNLKEYKIKFKHIRPGTYYKFNKKFNLKNNRDTKNEPEPMYMLSNGTIIAMGDLSEVDALKFRHDSLDLADHLKTELDQIFDETLQPKFKTVWCTLGYFDCDDFMIDDECFNCFQTFKNFNKEVTLEKLHICRYNSKSLNDAEIIRTINLK
jgi:hypothetical protein